MRIEYVVMAERFTDEERNRYLANLCGHQTAYGMPGIEYCPNKLRRLELRRGSIVCDEHERDAAEQGIPVLRLSYVFAASDAEVGMRVCQWNGTETGWVREIDGETVVVEFDVNPKPKTPGAKCCRFLSAALDAGLLVKDPR
jgi:hypothetical protein